MSRITPGTMIVLIFAMLFGLVGAYAVRRHLESTPPAQVAEKKQANTHLVPMASIDLPAGRPITLGDIMINRMTREKIKKQNLPAQYMTAPNQIIGRILREPMVKGTVFETVNFYPEGMGPSVAERLKPGLRAVTVEIDGKGAVNGFAGSGSFVDVLFRTNEDKARRLPETTITLLESVEVLAIGDNAIPGAKNIGDLNTVTLAVSADQASSLKIVEGRGAFSLSLRNPSDDTTPVKIGPQTIESLLNLPEQPMEKKPFTAEIYRGSSRSTIQFEYRSEKQKFTAETSPSGAVAVKVKEFEVADADANRETP